MLVDVREATDHSEKGAVVVAKIRVEALVLPKAILKQTPRHLVVTASVG